MVIFTEEPENQNQPGLLSYCNEEEDAETEKWLKYYSSHHQILLVGDGDFSFSLSLALSFGSASNIVASSLDSYEDVIKKYKRGKYNLEMLHKLGAFILHEVDATKMRLHSDLRMRKFDRIIYNFPHAGFHGKEAHAGLIRMHRNLVNGFFRNASGMLRNKGEIHVNHKTTAPFCYWDLEDLAGRNYLALIKCADFKIKDYPGYNNKRGAGDRCDDSFRLGKCGTFMFRFSSTARKRLQSRRNLDSRHANLNQLQNLAPQRPKSVACICVQHSTYTDCKPGHGRLKHLQNLAPHQHNSVACVQRSVFNVDRMPGYEWSPLAGGSRSKECYRTTNPTSRTPAYATSRITAYPTSIITAYPYSRTTTNPTSKISASPSSRTTANPTSKTTAYPASEITAYPSSRNTAYPASEITAYPSSRNTTYPSSRTTVYPASKITAYSSSKTTGNPASRITAHPTSRTTAYPASRTTAYPASRTTAYPASKTTAYAAFRTTPEN